MYLVTNLNKIKHLFCFKKKAAERPTVKRKVLRAYKKCNLKQKMRKIKIRMV